MRYGVLGTGVVGTTIASKLVELGHEVTIGSRTAGNERARAWQAQHAARAATGTFEDAAKFGQIMVNATAGSASLGALGASGEQNLAGKVLIDIANPLQQGTDFPPSLSICNTDSLGEQIQRSFPEARVVKTLNTMSAAVMVDPAAIPGGHAVFVCGDDAAAKEEVTALLLSFGWSAGDILDLGGIDCARGTEMYLALWLRMYMAQGSGSFNIRIVRTG